jgi:hypothetical protein
MNSLTSTFRGGKRKDEGVPPSFSMITFSSDAEGHATAPRKRARFNPERRLQVQGVRKRGACMRCRLLKIPVSALSYSSLAKGKF